MTDPYFAALAGGDEQEAVAYVLGLVDAGRPPVDVLLDVIAPAQFEVGRRWATGEWSVAHEHAATAISESAAAAVAARIPVPERPRGHVVVACAEREWHGLPARLVAHALRAAGWRTTYLGASTPPGHLSRYLDDRSADAVAVSCSVLAGLPAARRMIDAARTAGLPVLVGGRAFGADGQRAKALGADGWAADARDAVAVLDRLVARSDVDDDGAPAEEGLDEHGELMLRFGEFREAVRGRWLGAPGNATAGDTERETIDADAVDHALHAVAAALLADDPRLLAEARDWLRELYGARGYESGAADRLWSAVRSVIAPHLPRAAHRLDALTTAAR